MNKHLKIFLVIFLSSSSSLAYEITLMRIFSISMWYHFAFMIISIAMLGIGASGTVLSLYPKLKNLSHLGTYSLMLGIGISLSYLISNQIPFDPVKLSWSKTEILYIAIYYIILSLPFFFMGMIITTALSSLSEKSGFLYGADLLGAGTGSLAALCIMTLTGPDTSVLIISSIALTAAVLICRKIQRILSFILILITISLIFLRPSYINLRMSPYKGLQTAMTYTGAEHIKTYLSPYSRIDTFKSPVVRFAPGISLRYLDVLPEQIGISIDGGEITAVTRYDDKASLTFLKYLPSSLPYEITMPPLRTEGMAGSSGQTGNPQDVLILDPKGGLQNLVAEYYGSVNIEKIENNPLLIRVINEDLNTFSGGIYSRNTWSGLGRSWLKSTNKRFDIIDIPMMGTAPSGSFGISEDFRFTAEAFSEYLCHLKPDGLLSINLFILPPPRIELRILTTAVMAMEKLGIKDIERHVAAIRSWGSICILLKRSPFTRHEIEGIKRFSKNLRFDLIHYPGIHEEETNLYVRMKTNDYFHAFKSIIHPETRNNFINNYLFNINPVSDDKPFFHYYLKLKNIREIYTIMGGKWQYFIEEGYILPAVFVQVILLSSILIIIPAIKYNKGNGKVKKNNNPGLNLLPYFAFIGIGFMFVEVSIIQQIILPLEIPSYAAATVITAILISSGIGSLLSYRIYPLRSPVITAVVSMFIILYTIFLPYISGIISPHLFTVKIIIILFILMPLGFLMGIPFPAGLKILSNKNQSLIPWAWAINGCLSVLAPILTVILAMAVGFKLVLWIGALTYAIAFLIMKRFLKKTTETLY
ncbi:MAG: hypothetical protein WA126_09025 [Thermodesulfovibrionales bacterium]